MKTFYDLFAGIGGFRLGLERAGYRCIGSCEIEQAARKIYAKNFGAEPEARDVKELDASAPPQFDILCAGFPCQAFSFAGKRLGFKDTRGTLFFEIARIAKQRRPKLLFLENVKGLLSHDGGRTFGIILNTLYELGYSVEWQVINGRYFLPQNRERVFIIGHLGEKPFKQIFPLGDYDQVATKGKKTPAVRTLTAGAHSSGLHSQMTVISTDARSVSGLEREVVNVIDASYAKGATKHGDRSMIAVPVIGIDRKIKHCNGRIMKENGEPSFTLTTQDNHGIYDGQKIRRLTPLECERLQGFPPGWTKGVSDTARYRLLGNAVMPPVVEYIARHF